MKNEKSPQCLARRSRGRKNGNKIIANSNIKNNTPDLILNRNKSGAFSHNTAAPYGGA